MYNWRWRRENVPNWVKQKKPLKQADLYNNYVFVLIKDRLKLASGGFITQMKLQMQQYGIGLEFEFLLTRLETDFGGNL